MSPSISSFSGGFFRAPKPWRVYREASRGPWNEATLSSGQFPLRALPSPSFPKVYSSNRPLRIGYYESDGFTQPSPSMARAMKLTSKLLRDAGHQVGLLSPWEGGQISEDAGLVHSWRESLLLSLC